MTNDELVTAIRKGSGYMTVMSAAFCRAAGVVPRTSSLPATKRCRQNNLVRGEIMRLMCNERPVNVSDVW